MLQYICGWRHLNFGQAVMGLAGVVLMPLACSSSLHSQDLFKFTVLYIHTTCIYASYCTCTCIFIWNFLDFLLETAYLN